MVELGIEMFTYIIITIVHTNLKLEFTIILFTRRVYYRIDSANTATVTHAYIKLQCHNLIIETMYIDSNFLTITYELLFI